MIYQAVILSAGLGTRLRPLTEKLPKVMIPIAQKPLLEHHILQFKRYRVREFFVNLHYLPDVIQSYFGRGSKWGVKINYNFEPKILGTAGGLKSFEPKLKDEFFVIYGDIFSKVNYLKMYKYWKTKPEAIGIQRIGDTDNPQDKDLVQVDENLKFIKVYPKPHSKLPKNYKAMRGIFIFKKRILSYIPKNTYYEIGRDLLPDILKKGEKFYGYQCDDYSIGIDNQETYAKVLERFGR